ncbi:breast cancer anti-estrogen resistance protein 3 homolog isoform X1 [Lethenteron reissneri]|uniref:breast cancer anti-estrogen resistance protein 3 homolog isoform X1 n=2 Tax=Lethenteron reissneri TaxID=7753 RepID=UPI002AB63490|nr:breast cancer anti-estrogen resistance protein 3 homolog isoform X1 [Lethenteron reissneri]
MRNLPTSWWLQQLGLPEYSRALEHHFALVEDLLHLSEAQLRELGVRNAAHRAHIMSSIRCLRAQVQRRDHLKPRAMQSVGGPAMLSRQTSLGSAGDLIVGRNHHCHPQQLASVRAAQAYPSTLHGTLPRKRPVGRAASCGVEQERSQPWLRQNHSSLMHKSEGYADGVKVPHAPGTAADWSADRLKRELESELKLDSEDVRSHAWYHGAIPRQVAESQLERDGDFLLRDSLSGAGGLVLSCRWAERPLHFRVERRTPTTSTAAAAAQQRSSGDGHHRRSLGDSYAIQPGGDGFGSVPSLVRFYVGNRQPVSPGQPGPGGFGPVCIARPVNRAVPLAYLAAVHRDAARLAELAAHGGSNDNNNSCGFDSFYRQERPERHAGCAGNHGAGGCCCGDGGGGGCDVRGHQGSSKRHQLTDTSYRNGMVFDWTQDGRASEAHAQGNTLPGYGTGADIWRDGLRRTPTWSPKGLRSAQPSAHADLSWTTSPPPANGTSGAVPASGKHAEERLAGDSEPYHSLISPHKAMEALERDAAALRLESDVNAEFRRPTVETESTFRPLEFASLLLPPENKPLETGVLRRAKELQGECDVRTAARCIMLLDCEVARITGVTEELVLKMGVRSGLELLTLPHGRRLREDVIERFHALAIGLAVDVLGCTGCLEERAELLHRYVQLALELRGPLADLYGFSAVMHALMLPQVSRLERTWEVLRRAHTQSAVAFEKELKPFLLALQQGKVHVDARDTSVPHLLPLVSLLEEPMPPAEPSAAVPAWPPLPAERTGSGGDWEREWARGGASAGEAWEQPGDAGMEAVVAHLQAGREMARDAALYSANAERRLRGFSVDPATLETFRTEFHLRLYWGSRGCRAERHERLHKFHHILSALSARLESPQRHSEL